MKECSSCKKCFQDDLELCPNDQNPLETTVAGDVVLDGRYQLELRLGQGGMGIVYKARHIFLKTSHAIKIILPDLVGNDPQLVTRFRQEAMAAAAIRHSNIIAVTDFGVVQGRMPFLVMEFIRGVSLHDLIAEHGKFSPTETLEIMLGVGAGVGAAHRQGIVHRDLKPLNIMLQNGALSREAVKVLDFGLAKIKSADLLSSFLQAQTLGLMGSPFYMSPEQWSDEEPDRRSDIYSLGVIVYQMLSGKVPFAGASLPSIMKKHVMSAPPPFRNVGVRVPSRIEEVVFRALEKDPDNRADSVEAFIEELRDAVARPASSPDDNTPADETYYQSGSTSLRPTSRDQFAETISSDAFIEIELERLSASGAAAQRLAQEQRETRRKANQSSSAGSAHSASLGAQTIESTSAVATQPSFYAAAHKRFSSSITLWSIIISGAVVFGGLLYLLKTSPGVSTVPDAANTDLTNVKENPEKDIQAPQLTTEAASMALIPGGKFRFGRNDGDPIDGPVHTVEVKRFWMDKTEVTNAEYARFTRETNYRFPSDWKNGSSNKPLLPVTHVSLEDAEAFARWRTQRDTAAYRLPTEAEWEYAARNGEQDNLYPWGNSWQDDCAVINRSAPESVGLYPACGNRWGVLDLIGNVKEWTSSNFSLYPGSSAARLTDEQSRQFVIRGGSYKSSPSGKNAITSTYRDWVPRSEKGLQVGFRLVRTEELPK